MMLTEYHWRGRDKMMLAEYHWGGRDKIMLMEYNVILCREGE